MKKNVFGKKLGRDSAERKALFKGLMSELILRESIKTTEAKAKAIKPEIEKFVTKAKKADSGAQAVLVKNLTKPAFDKLIKEIGPRFEKRQGGYTRIVKLGERLGDNSSKVLIEWVERPVQSLEPKTKNVKEGKSDKEPKAKKTDKKVQKSGKAKTK